MQKSFLVKFVCTTAIVGCIGFAGFGLSGVNADNTTKKQDTYRQLNLFGDVFDRVRSDYVEIPDEEKLIDAAVSGMLASLDPHSSYMNEKKFQEMRIITGGKFGGLGIEVTMENGIVKVVTPIDDTPASRAGILAGDFITHLDGKQVLGMTLGEAVEKMRGKIDDPITLTVVREGKDEPFDVNIIRGEIKIRPVRFSKEGDIGYVRITTFNEQTQQELNKAIRKLRSEIPHSELKGYVIDLRNNPGGLLEQAVSVSDSFLERGEIVSTRGRDNKDTQRYSAKSGDLTKGKPVVVLINGGSASASEIVAGALQDHQRATILGTRSFGKGSVQTIIPLGEGNGAIRLTTARYYTPSGTSIQAKGIDPDLIVEQKLPDDLKKQFNRKPVTEKSLPGHLKGENEKSEDEKKNESENKENNSGSISYVPKDKKEDKQLQQAFNLLRGVDILKEEKKLK